MWFLSFRFLLHSLVCNKIKFLNPYLGPDIEEIHNSHTRFISPRPSGSGSKLYLHDNSLKCRANQQKKPALSSFSSALAMSNPLSSNNCSGNSNNNNNNCSTHDGTRQIQQTPSILAAATLPRNFSNQGNYLNSLVKLMIDII